MSPLDAATGYLRRGYAVIPVPYRGKNPGLDGWQQLRITLDTADQHFNGAPQNIGALLGEPSGWIIDVDLDHKRAVELAADFLPPTPAVFGRESKLRSHFVYRVTSPVATKKFRSKSAGMIVELRSPSNFS
ncbi:bifunctional DNA primase/polymerase [Anatilimnocola floriformis]|uniref:bifunctional DNA primase/polymerase n=1 Tax=Anatilimnocola floriformis TaxID=2948575 RepID=UPI0020C22FE5|nr:bifunctional DNA primase/polymerase [Anatilimnocola floriformis]